MKELNSFTVERLEELSEIGDMANDRYLIEVSEVRRLARIALAAKRAEPVAYADRQAFENFRNGKATKEWMWADPDSGLIALYTTPQLNSPEIPEGWKLTPLKPTVDMIAAAMECDDVVYDLDDDTIFCVQFDNIYAAMLAAAPEKENG